MRTLGNTALAVSRLGLGLAALGRPGYINIGHADDLARNYDLDAMRARAHAVLDAGWHAGVRYFDAARSYGRAEEFLASWLGERQIAPRAVTIGSKWGYTYTAGWRVDAQHHEIKDHSLANLERQLIESRALLGDQLDLYQIHSATAESGVLDNRAVLERLAHLRDGGLVIGLSLSGPRQADTLRRALDIEIGGRRVFDSVQATWNLLERSVEGALRDAHTAGMGVIVKEGLANGRLTARNNAPAFAATRRRLDTVARRLNCPLDALALAAILAQPWADVALSGAATEAHLASNLSALDVKIDKEAHAELRAVVEKADEYWTTRGRMAWN